MQTNKTILIIDDDPSILKMLGLRLKTEGFNVLTAASGKDGIAIAYDQKPDLIILDIMMPGLDGTEARNELYNDYRTSDIPVIFLTGLEKKSEDMGSHEVGGRIVFAKPYNPAELIHCIKKLLKLDDSTFSL